MNPESDVASPTDRRSLIRNGVLAFVLGALIMIVLHESSHAVAGALLGYRPIQLPFAVDYVPAPSTRDAVVTAATGPLFSLVTGLVGVAIDRARTPFRGRPFWRLVWLWLVFASIQEGFGYFFIAGIISAGDTARALSGLGAPGWAYGLSTVVGIGGLFLTARLFATPVFELSSSVSDKRAIAVWPWLFGTLVLVAIMTVFVLASPSVPVGDVVAVLPGVVAVGVCAPMSMMFRRGHYGAASPPTLPRHPVGGYVLLGLVIAFDLVLSRGWLWL